MREEKEKQLKEQLEEMEGNSLQMEWSQKTPSTSEHDPDQNTQSL